MYKDWIEGLLERLHLLALGPISNIEYELYLKALF